MPSAERSITVAVSPPDFMVLLLDFESYPSFLPDMCTAEVTKQSASGWEVRFSLQVIRRLTYTLALTQPTPLSLQWTLVEGLFRANSGGWALQPDGEHGTLATYSIDIQLGMFVPGNILNSLVAQGLPQTLEHFREEASRRAGVLTG
jgi:ribosome-associated toxin RatA of RatAB toxin-antitoxin module